MTKKLFLLPLLSLLLAVNAFAAPPVHTIFPLNQLYYNSVNSNSIGELRTFKTVAASQNDSELIALTTGKVIRIVAMVVVPGATASSSTFESNSTAISGAFTPGNNTPLVFPYNPAGWYETVSGQAFKVDTGAGSDTVYQISYVVY